MNSAVGLVVAKPRINAAASSNPNTFDDHSAYGVVHLHLSMRNRARFGLTPLSIAGFVGAGFGIRIRPT